MDLIQHYTSETESETETQEEGDRDFPIESDEKEGENKLESQTSIPPPLPNIEIYLQLYQQNMSQNSGHHLWVPSMETTICSDQEHREGLFAYNF